MAWEYDSIDGGNQRGCTPPEFDNAQGIFPKDVLKMLPQIYKKCQ